MNHCPATNLYVFHSNMCISIQHFAQLSLKMQFMNNFNRAMNLLDEKFSFLASEKQIVSSVDEDDKVQMLYIHIVKAI